MMSAAPSRVFLVAIPVSIFVGIVFYQSTLTLNDVKRYKFPTKPPSPKFIQNEKDLFKHDLCLLYDKPKRTGSTTVAKSLQQCWLHHNNIPTTAREGGDPLGPLETRVKNLLLLDKPVVMFALFHVHISDRDIRRIAYVCNQFLYITSTRPMQQRFTSFIKASALRKLAGSNNVYANATISVEGLRQGAKNLRFHAKRLEPYYETYPFTGTMRLKPDYVVRNEFIEQDTKLLLRAFGCPEQVASTNVHSTEQDTNSDLEPLSSPEQIPDHTADSPTRVIQSKPTVNNLTPPTSSAPSFSRDTQWFWTVNLTTLPEDELRYFTKNFPVSMGDGIFKELTSLAESNNKQGLSRIQKLMPLINSLKKESPPT